MVIIRLSRVGAKKRPFYHIVVADSRFPRNGRCIEKIGFVNPLLKEQHKIDQDRLKYWLLQGAQPSQRVAGIIKYIAKAA